MSESAGSLLLVGVGGQGVILASAIVADAALRAGHDVKQSEVLGMAQRGGVVSSHLSFGPEVFSPLVEPGQADAVVGLEWNEGLRSLAYLRPGAPLIVSLHRVVPPGSCRDRLSGELAYPALALDALLGRAIDVRACDAAGIARELGSPRAQNSVLLGVLARLLPFPERAWREALEAHAPRGTFAANERAFLAGRALSYPEETYAQATRLRAVSNGHPARGRRRPAALDLTRAWCKGGACAICVRVCPEECLAIDGADRVVVSDPGACTGCRLCELLCPDFAIAVREEAAPGAG